MTYFYDQSEPPRREIAPGINARIFWGDKVMMSLVEIAPDSKMPAHAHPNEQAGIVMQGEFDFTIGGQTKRIKQGDVYVIPGDVEHALVASDGWALALDIFSPPREEYKP